ncbi:MAG: acyltransferase [Brevundimonas sp.]|nr:MAG: acyltransferase [Brevundimonas sp.]
MTPVETPQDLRSLTALRFMAAAWVAVYAFWPDLSAGGQPLLVGKGYLGVELFFVLSGFILSHVYLAAAGEARFSYRGFLWARIARVYPLHLFTLLAVGVLGVAATVAGMAIDANILSWSSLPANLLMVHAWGFAPTAGWNHPSWSISAEWFAYLTFPAFAFVAWKLRARPWAAVLAAVVFLGALYWIFPRVAGFSLTEATIRWGALRIVPCFALGCALYLVYRSKPLARPALWAVACAVLMLTSAAFGLWDAITVVMAGGLILALSCLPNARAGVLASAPAVYLGEVSYSVYMVLTPYKLVAVNVAKKALGLGDAGLPPVVWLTVLLGLVPAAMLSYHLVEKPARRWLRSFADARAKRKGASTQRTNSHDTRLQPPGPIV